MDANKVIAAILEAAKPMIVTQQSKENFVQICQKSGISIDSNLTLTGSVTQSNVETLIDNLDSGVLKLVVRKVMRNF